MRADGDCRNHYLIVWLLNLSYFSVQNFVLELSHDEAPSLREPLVSVFSRRLYGAVVTRRTCIPLVVPKLPYAANAKIMSSILIGYVHPRPIF